MQDRSECQHVGLLQIVRCIAGQRRERLYSREILDGEVQSLWQYRPVGLAGQLHEGLIGESVAEVIVVFEGARNIRLQGRAQLRVGKIEARDKYAFAGGIGCRQIDVVAVVYADKQRIVELRRGCRARGDS